MPLTSFYTALTGLNNNALSINVIGNNLANINTTAYKTSKTSFAELLGGLAGTGSGNGNPIQIGLGSYVPTISPVLNQGSVAYTGRPTDAAINGNGFFVVATGGGQLGFTRSGSFGFTSSGELINSEGFQVQGYKAVNGVVNSSGALAPIVVEKGQALPPKTTSEMGISANLDSQASDGDTFATAVQVYDSLGSTHTVTLTFTKNGSDWGWDATIPAVDTGGAATDPPVSVGTGSLTFDGAGVMTAPTANATLNITGLANAADDFSIDFNILDDAGNPRFTSYASESSVSTTTQNGYSSSVLKDINIDSTGVITGTFDNGQVQALAQLALANFPNVEGLLKFEGSTYVAFGTSGEPSIGAPGSGGRGSISGSSLEQSNVDIASEFTNLIVAQRGYQANSRIITTTDELYQDSINLKR